MKNLSTLLWVLAAAILLGGCANPKGTVINGNFTGAQNLQAFFDLSPLGKASTVLTKADIDGNGRFSMQFPEGLASGIYKLRIGAKQINLVLDGTEGVVELNGNLETMQNYDLQVAGSPHTQTLAGVMQGLMQRRYTAEDIGRFVDTVSSPTLGVLVAYRSLGTSGEFLDIQKRALQRLNQVEPSSDLSQEYSMYIQNLEQQYAAQRATELIQVGQPAPDITLNNPNGKPYSLSDLKGKVVLLDFWASWCGPCRRENPNVVEVYRKYKNRGFTVYSVSLDGLDSRAQANMQGNQLEQAMEAQRQRWTSAIQQDNLEWEYHVSDLRKWESGPAAVYGVRSIPRTFLIDRNGNIAATNLRGAAQIEQALQALL